MRTHISALLLAFAGCGDKTDETEVPAECAESPTWDGFAEGYIATWCLPCHTASLTGESRQGAPEATNFDTYSDVYQWRASILNRAVTTFDTNPMPPLGGVPTTSVELFGQWLECGAVGADDPPEPCAAIIAGPAATIADQADADAFCASYNAAESLTVVGTADLSCLCSVDGAVSIEGGAVDLPLLSDVTGDFSVSDATVAVRASALAHVGGDVLVDSADSLVEFDLTGMETVDGALTLQHLAQLPLVSFDALYSVGGELTVTDAALVTFDIPRLRSTGGDLVLQDLPALTAILGTRSVDNVGGSLILQDLPSLTLLADDAFWFMYTVGQDVIISNNDALAAVNGFTLLQDVPGVLAVEDNEALVSVNGFDNLLHVGGDVRLRNNPKQLHVLGLYNIKDIDGALVLENLFAANALLGFNELEAVGELRLAQVGEVLLSDFIALATVEADLTITGGAKMTGIDGFDVLTAVGGDFELSNNEDLADIVGLLTITSIGGDVAVANNPELSEAAILAWLGTVTVGGTVAVTGNGP